MRLPTDKQINRILDLWKERGLEVGALDVTADGVFVRVPGETAAEQTPFDIWEKQDNGRSAHN